MSTATTKENVEIAKEFGKKIKRARFDLELSQRELAKKMNIVQSAISAWETGKKMPRGVQLIKLCRFLKIKL